MLAEMLGRRDQSPAQATCRVVIDGLTAADCGAIAGDRDRPWEEPIGHFPPAQLPRRITEQDGFG